MILWSSSGFCDPIFCMFFLFIFLVSFIKQLASSNIVYSSFWRWLRECFRRPARVYDGDGIP
jgi:hypothetical protein